MSDERERRPLVVGHHEDRGVERRLVAPPALPLVVGPGAALRAELVAAHDLGADVAVEVADQVVVEAAAAAGIGAVGPARRRARPGQQGRGSAWPNGRSRLCPSPAPYPSLDTLKLCTRTSCSTVRSSCIGSWSVHHVDLRQPAGLIAGETRVTRNRSRAYVAVCDRPTPPSPTPARPSCTTSSTTTARTSTRTSRSWMSVAAATVLDIGCGTGTLAVRLADDRPRRRRRRPGGRVAGGRTRQARGAGGDLGPR